MILRASRSISLLLATALVVGPSSAFAQLPPAPPSPSPPSASVSATATTEIAAGDKATRAKDFAGALTHYQAAQQAVPSSRAEMGVADAYYNAGRLGESYDTYADIQQTYAGKLGAMEKALVAKRIKELATKTGYLSVRVSETGAEVDVDGKPLGTSPVPALVRVATGAHDLHITKTGFAPFDGKAEVAPDGKAVVDATLVAVATRGHVVVHATGPDSLRVIVDGVDVGATPWEGDLPPGSHTIAGRSSTASAQGQTVDVTVGSKTAIDLVPAGTTAHVDITTSDGKGIIYVDGVVKGEGKFSGDVAPGPHTVIVSRDGYTRFEQPITLAEHQTWAQTVTLTQVAGAGGGQGEAERAYEGLYGGFGLMGMFGVGGMGTTLETNCPQLGAESCNTPNPIGGGAIGYIGYTWNPVGFEFALGGLVDQAKQTATYAATTSSGGPTSLVPAATPARTETFSFLRVGAMAAARVRVAFQTHLIRGVLAAGPGISLKQIVMERDAAANDNSGASDKYVPGGVMVFSPALSGEAAVQVRLSQTVAMAIGLEFWADSASVAGTNSVPPGGPHPFTGSSSTSITTIPTPGYNLATGPQVLLGPFIGMQFGP